MFLTNGEVNVRDWFGIIPAEKRAGFRPLSEEDLVVGAIIFMVPIKHWDTPKVVDIPSRTIPLEVVGLTNGEIQYRPINGHRVHGAAQVKEAVSPVQQVSPLDPHPFALFLVAVA
ncbi:MAG: hypothetical protein AAB645_02450 [Patescibacteria group bacterium]